MTNTRYFIFDLDGTLVDNVYQHVLAWKGALDEAGIVIPAWRVHRRIGMSGSLLVRELAQEFGQDTSPDHIEFVRKRHGEIFKTLTPVGKPLPGAQDLLAHLTAQAIPWAIATSGHAENARAALQALHVAPDNAVVVTRDQVESAKPEPDLFLEAAKRLGKPIEDALVAGDSIWDMLAAKRANATGIGLLSGGYADSELKAMGADRVCDDPADLLHHIDELMRPGR